MNSMVKNNLNIYIAGFGCCKQEIFASSSPTYDISRFGVNFVSLPEEADIIVIQGFYNAAGAEQLMDCYNLMKEPKWVIAAGKCVIDHEIFNIDHKVIQKNKIKVDIFVPGCPPRPEAFIYAILRLKDIC